MEYPLSVMNKIQLLFVLLSLIFVISSVQAAYVEQEVIDKLTQEEWVRVSITFGGVSSDEILNKLGNNFLLEDKDQFYDQWIGGKITQVAFDKLKNETITEF